MSLAGRNEPMSDAQYQEIKQLQYQNFVLQMVEQSLMSREQEVINAMEEY